MRAIRLFPVMLAVGIVVLAACSEDSECPTCPTCPACECPAQWAEYDNFDDNLLDTGLWNYIMDC